MKWVRHAARMRDMDSGHDFSAQYLKEETHGKPRSGWKTETCRSYVRVWDGLLELILATSDSLCQHDNESWLL
jgi:hypothetical protein